jgi:hypothetical protein
MRLLLIVLLWGSSQAWQQWTSQGVTDPEWQALWGKAQGPSGRMGHSLVLYDNGTKVVMFGGRDNEVTRRHIPRTYNISRENGILQFVDYDQKPVLECQVSFTFWQWHA